MRCFGLPSVAGCQRASLRTRCQAVRVHPPQTNQSHAENQATRVGRHVYPPAIAEVIPFGRESQIAASSDLVRICDGARVRLNLASEPVHGERVQGSVEYDTEP